MNEDFAILLFFFGVSLTLNLALAVSWFRSSRRVRRLEDHLLAPRHAPDPRAGERFDEAFESLSAQVEQLASGQEFLNRVVAERLERLRAPAEAERVVTPH